MYKNHYASMLICTQCIKMKLVASISLVGTGEQSCTGVEFLYGIAAKFVSIKNRFWQDYKAICNPHGNHREYNSRMYTTENEKNIKVHHLNTDHVHKQMEENIEKKNVSLSWSVIPINFKTPHIKRYRLIE